mmetsp:Transcript_12686/g.17679  ORF Transcript_12686/g.17679 Transcript_12686/m.17679 type:complete len:82 (+) Transcript_12686:230-475(+)
MRPPWGLHSLELLRLKGPVFPGMLHLSGSYYGFLTPKSQMQLSPAFAVAAPLRHLSPFCQAALCLAVATSTSPSGWVGGRG